VAGLTLVGVVVFLASNAARANDDGEPALLHRLKAWMGQNNAVIMAVLLLVIGAKLIGDAIGGFSS
jgi:hypothetical protein